jgi:hypothetical protein
LVKGLPRESLFAREEDPEGVLWGLSEHLLATVIEAVVNSNRTKKSDPVFEYPRPGVGSQRTSSRADGQRSHRRSGGRRVSMADMASMIGT